MDDGIFADMAQGWLGEAEREAAGLLAEAAGCMERMLPDPARAERVRLLVERAHGMYRVTECLREALSQDGERWRNMTGALHRMECEAAGMLLEAAGLAVADPHLKTADVVMEARLRLEQSAGMLCVSGRVRHGLMAAGFGAGAGFHG